MLFGGRKEGSKYCCVVCGISLFNLTQLEFPIIYWKLICSSLLIVCRLLLFYSTNLENNK